MWEAIDNQQELDLRSSRVASFDEIHELWMEGKLNWTAELSLVNEAGGGRGAVGRLTDRCNPIQYDPTRVKHKQIWNYDELCGNCWKAVVASPDFTKFHADLSYHCHSQSCNMSSALWSANGSGLPHSLLLAAQHRRFLQAMGALAWTRHQPTCLALAPISCQTRCVGASQDSLEKESLAHPATTLRTIQTSIGHHALLVLRQRCARKLVQRAEQLASVQSAVNPWAMRVAAIYRWRAGTVTCVSIARS